MKFGLYSLNTLCVCLALWKQKHSSGGAFSQRFCAQDIQLGLCLMRLSCLLCSGKVAQPRWNGLIWIRQLPVSGTGAVLCLECFPHIFVTCVSSLLSDGRFPQSSSQICRPRHGTSLTPLPFRLLLQMSFLICKRCHSHRYLEILLGI